MTPTTGSLLVASAPILDSSGASLNRRIIVPVVLIGGLAGLGLLLQATGGYAGGSISGAATGTTSAGCAGEPGVVAQEDLAAVQVGTALTPEAPRAQPSPTPGAGDAVDGQYVVKLRSDKKPLSWQAGAVQSGDPDLDGIFADLGALDLAPLAGAGTSNRDTPSPQAGVYSLSLDSDLADVQDALYNHQDVEWVEPVFVTHAALAPDDPLYPLQWNLDSQAIGGVHDITIGVGITVAVLDSGIVPGPDGVANLAPGLDFIDDDEDPTDADASRSPNGSHGTHMAGILAQSTNNGVGSAGLAPGVTVLPIRVLGWDDQADALVGRSDHLAQAIVWAADHGAAVIHMSVTTPRFSKAVADACDYAYSLGATLVAAAGNGGYSDHIDFPAALPSVIAVGATDLNHQVPGYSNRGRDLELVAPGGTLYDDADGDGMPDGVGAETLRGDAHDFLLLQGTSQAAVHVTAAAALLRSVGVDDPNDVRTLLQDSAFDQGDEGPDGVYGHGELSIQGALQLHQERSAAVDEDPQPSQTMALVNPLGDDRVVINWLTSEPMTTGAEDDQGLLFETDDLRTTHAVMLQGEPGDELRVIVFGRNDDGLRLDQEVVVRFGSGPDQAAAAPAP